MAETGWPFTWVTRYQLEPDFQPGQLVPHEVPVTVADTATALARDSDVLTDALVEGLVRRLTPAQAGTYEAPAGPGEADGPGVAPRVGTGAIDGAGVTAVVGVGVGVGVGEAVGTGGAAAISTPVAA